MQLVLAKGPELVGISNITVAEDGQQQDWELANIETKSGSTSGLISLMLSITHHSE